MPQASAEGQQQQTPGVPCVIDLSAETRRPPADDGALPLSIVAPMVSVSLHPCEGHEDAPRSVCEEVEDGGLGASVTPAAPLRDARVPLEEVSSPLPSSSETVRDVVQEGVGIGMPVAPRLAFVVGSSSMGLGTSLPLPPVEVPERVGVESGRGDNSSLAVGAASASREGPVVPCGEVRVEDPAVMKEGVNLHSIEVEVTSENTEEHVKFYRPDLCPRPLPPPPLLF